MIDLHLYQIALRDLLRIKRLVVSAILVSTPAVLALAVRAAMGDRFDGTSTYEALVAEFVYGFVLVIMSVVFGTGVIAQELENKTMVYLLTRPLPRWRVLLAKFAAAVTLVVTTTLFSLLALYCATYVGDPGARSPSISARAVADPGAILTEMKPAMEPVTQYIDEQIPPDVRSRLESINLARANPMRMRRIVTLILDPIIEQGKDLYDEERFASVTLPAEVVKLAKSHPTGIGKMRLNRLLLEARFGKAIIPSQSGKTPIMRDLAVLPVGALAYSALCLLLACILNKAIIVGLVFAFGWEPFVPMLGGSFRLVTITTYLRALAPHTNPSGGAGPLDFLMPAAEAAPISETTAWLVLTGAIVLAVLGAALAFTTREFVPRDES